MSAGPPRRRGRPPSGGREAILAATLELMRERGIARLTTREVAQRAGVSEASVFYHYTDRAGLLRAVFAAGIPPLQQLGEDGLTGSDHREVLLRLSKAIERFLDQALPVIMAAQSDTELRDSMAAYLQDNSLGPHRGVQLIAAYLAAEQAAGRVNPAIDPEAVGLLVVGSSFLRAAQRQIMTHTQDSALPEGDRAIELIDQLLAHPGVSAWPSVNSSNADSDRERP